LTAFFFGDGVVFFVRDDFFATAFFYLFTIPIPPIRLSAAQRPPSSMNEQALATIPILIPSVGPLPRLLGFNKKTIWASDEAMRHGERLTEHSQAIQHESHAMMEP
jgi:hypothetical protein